MALEVPDSPKVYTTKYANFKGVDYTNDASNVWYRRSPDGLNMLPDLDGKPYKRNGWKIEISSEDFCTAAGISPTDVDQYKVDYFELSGANWLVFYTSIGLFFYGDELYYINTYKPYIRNYRRKTATYAVGDYCYLWKEGGVANKTFYRCNTAITVPEVFTSAHWDALAEEPNNTKSFPPTEMSDVTVDYTKSFFFEGGGNAGYYLFVGTMMFVFDGIGVENGTGLKEVEPKIPTLLVGCYPSGVGTTLEAVNMLTEYRAVQYMGDGSTLTFVVPSGYGVTDYGGTNYATGIFNVYVLNASGEWVITNNWGIGDNAGEIKFTAGNAPASSAVDNVRIVYIPLGLSPSETAKTSSTMTLKITKTTKKTTSQMYTTKWEDFGSTTTVVTYTNDTKPSASLTSPKKPLSTYVTCDLYDKNGWHNNDSSLEKSFDSYGSKVTVSGKGQGKTTYEKWSADVSSTTSTTYTSPSTLNGIKIRNKIVTIKQTKTFKTRVKHTSIIYSTTSATSTRNAFFATSRVLVFGNGIINQAFLTASTSENYSTRVWYSAATDPTYFPDINYIEVGATDKKIMGLIRVGEYLGVVKRGGGTDASVYLAYPTSFENTTTYAVKQSINGVGSISNGAFNILNDEPLFLSADGVMGIEPAEDNERKIRNRSYYINKPLLAEPAAESAFSFTFNGMYWLCVNNHVYVLDGSQKNSWENTKTNLQYEAYYLDNIPAKCFAKKDGRLWFIDKIGNACSFRDNDDELRYVDAYDADALTDENIVIHKASVAPTNNVYNISDLAELKVAQKIVETTHDHDTAISEINDWWANGTSINLGENIDSVLGGNIYGSFERDLITRPLYDVSSSIVGNETIVSLGAHDTGVQSLRQIIPIYESGEYTGAFEYGYLAFDYTYFDQADVKIGDVIQYGNLFYTIYDVGESTVNVQEGVPIHARWSTIADDDGSANYYKNLQKKGSLVALLPATSMGVMVFVKADEKDEKFIRETKEGEHILPFNTYLKKKIKKYKRLQIICENNNYNQSFGVDEIIKCYTMGNYAKR